MPPDCPSLAAAAAVVLAAATPADKIRLGRGAAELWRARRLPIGTTVPPDRPGRPLRPVLALPRDVPRRRISAAPAGRIALLHALAHIELNAIDLAWDIVARFTAAGLPDAFYDDWVGVAVEESLHHEMLQARLTELGAGYGDLPAHDGLWLAAMDTAHDLLARLAVVPMVLEARGLDVTPAMMVQLERAGDPASAAILRRIHDDEIGHVAVGVRWFEHVAIGRGLVPELAWQEAVRRHFKGGIKPPFNRQSRDRAGLPERYYLPLAIPSS